MSPVARQTRRTPATEDGKRPNHHLVLKEIEDIFGEPCVLREHRDIHISNGKPTERDLIVSTHPLLGQPYVHCSLSRCNVVAPGQGVTVMACRSRPNLKYAFAYGPVSDVQIMMAFPRRHQLDILLCLSRRARKENPEIAIPVIEASTMRIFEAATLGFLSRRRKLMDMGIRMSRGVVLSGPPGNGKTMLCAWLQEKAKSMGLSVSRIEGGALHTIYGRGQLTDHLASHDITILDDFDVDVLRRKGASAPLACALLTAMDFDKARKPCLRVVTTNEEPSDIDPAFLRPGRLETIIRIDPPTDDMRSALAMSWHPALSTRLLDAPGNGSTIDDLVRATRGMSFAEMDLVKAELATVLIERDEWSLPDALASFRSKRAGVAEMSSGGKGLKGFKE